MTLDVLLSCLPSFREFQVEHCERLTGCPSFGICTMVCFDGVTLICLFHSFNLSKFAIAIIQHSFETIRSLIHSSYHYNYHRHQYLFSAMATDVVIWTVKMQDTGMRSLIALSAQVLHCQMMTITSTRYSQQHVSSDLKPKCQVCIYIQDVTMAYHDVRRCRMEDKTYATLASCQPDHIWEFKNNNQNVDHVIA